MVTTWRVSPLSSLTVTANCRGSPPAVCRTSIIAKPPCARAVYSWPRILRQSRHATAPQAAQTDPPHEPRDIERRRDDAHPVGDDLGGDKDRVHGWQLLGWTHFSVRATGLATAPGDPLCQHDEQGSTGSTRAKGISFSPFD